jgi:hypothetical protein
MTEVGFTNTVQTTHTHTHTHTQTHTCQSNESIIIKQSQSRDDSGVPH